MHDGLIGGGCSSWNLGAILAYSWIRLQPPPPLFLLTLSRDTGRSLPPGLCLWRLSHFVPTCPALPFQGSPHQRHEIGVSPRSPAPRGEVAGGTASPFLAAGLQAQNLRTLAAGRIVRLHSVPCRGLPCPVPPRPPALEMAPPPWLALPSLVHVVGRCLSSSGA